MQHVQRQASGGVVGWPLKVGIPRGAGCLALGLVACSGGGVGEIDTGPTGADAPAAVVATADPAHLPSSKSCHGFRLSWRFRSSDSSRCCAPPSAGVRRSQSCCASSIP